MADGTKGNWVVLDADTRRQVACAKTKGDAQAFARERDRDDDND